MKENLLKTVGNNLKKAKFNDKPFVHWTFDNIFSGKYVNNLLELPLKPPVKFLIIVAKEKTTTQQEFFLIVKIVE